MRKFYKKYRYFNGYIQIICYHNPSNKIKYNHTYSKLSHNRIRQIVKLLSDYGVIGYMIEIELYK